MSLACRRLCSSSARSSSPCRCEAAWFVCARELVRGVPACAAAVTTWWTCVCSWTRRAFDGACLYFLFFLSPRRRCFPFSCGMPFSLLGRPCLFPLSPSDVYAHCRRPHSYPFRCVAEIRRMCRPPYSRPHSPPCRTTRAIEPPGCSRPGVLFPTNPVLLPLPLLYCYDVPVGLVHSHPLDTRDPRSLACFLNSLLVTYTPPPVRCKHKHRTRKQHQQQPQ